MSIHEYINKYLNYVEGRGRTLSTKEAYKHDLTKFSDYLITLKIDNIEKINSVLIEDYLFELKLSSATKERRRVIIKNFFEYLYRRKYITDNPTVGIDSIKVNQRRPEYLSSEQRETFLKTIEQQSTPYYKERDLMLARLLLDTGLRRAEVTGLNVSDIDLSKFSLRVKRKGNREEYVRIHPDLVGNIKKYLKLIHRDENQPLFLSKKGQRLSASSIWHIIKSYSRKAGFNEKVTVHSLRHSFATALLQESVPLPYIQALMGHKSSQTTARYIHIQDKDLIEIFNKVRFGRR